MAIVTIPDAILDEFTGQDVDLIRIEAQLIKEFRSKELRALEQKLINLLYQLNPSEPKRLTSRKIRANKAIKEALAIINEQYRSMSISLNRHMKDLADLEEELARQAINNAVGGAIATRKISDKALQQLMKDYLIQGAPSAEWWKRQKRDLINKFSDVILKGVTTSTSTQDIVRNLRGTRAEGFRDGILEGKRKQVEILVRTSVQTVANEARIASFKANSDIIQGIRWSSTLDNRTSSTCKGLDGLQWDLNYRPIGHSISYPGPTAHWGCRSSQLPVMVPYNKLSKGKQQKVPTGTRESLDGPVSAKHTYETWLKTKSVNFQKETLGEGRWNLWNKGKLSMRDLIDQSGNPRTIEQIRKATGGGK